MCKPVRYVHPGCGHPVDLGPGVWTIERCRLAHLSNRECWIPHDVPDELINRKTWPSDNLPEPCYMPHEAEISDEEFEISIMRQLTCVEEVKHTITLQAKDNNEDTELFAKDILLDGSILLNYNELIIEEEELLSDTESLLDSEDTLMGEDELNRYEQAFLLQDTNDDDLSYITKVLDQTATELSIAATEDNMEWAQVAALEVDMAPFGQADMDMDDHFPCEVEWL
ncbi:Ff.00g118810.m01.CDS01 [Fusarium sp. VM40]|nr:Ff.00g118810.m01.CDS01 [Fusarium sp. VM40]